MTEIFENMVLVSGSGRNAGKTTFIRKMIDQNIAKRVIAIKITPHFHEITSGLEPVITDENFHVFEETNRKSPKDSSLFLQAGAEKVLFIQAKDAYLLNAFESIVHQLHPDQPVIIESAALRKIMVPGLYIFIQKKSEKIKPSAIKMQKLADITVFSDGENFSINPRSINFNQTWGIHDHAAASH